MLLLVLPVDFSSTSRSSCSRCFHSATYLPPILLILLPRLVELFPIFLPILVHIPTLVLLRLLPLPRPSRQIARQIVQN